MADAGSKYTDKKITKLENQIVSVYTEAQTDIEAKLNEFNKKFKAKYQIHLDELHDGKITQEQFNSWVNGQVFQSNQWKAKRNQIIETIENANQIANQMVNGQTLNVFAMNANYQFYDIEHGTGINFGFGLYDNATVARLIKDNPQILPEWKIDEPKDYIWNAKKVNNAITQGIIQGESLDKIADRLSTQLCAQNRNLMLTHARTAMTGAQNAGRDTGLMQAKAKGIEVVKQWMATLDGRTRDSHRHMDGETIKVKDIWHPAKFSNGCRYPGDPQGPPQEVYNCRCTMVGDVEEYPSVYKRYDNIDGKPIKNMTYDEWAKAKGGVGHTKSKYKYAKTAQAKIDYAKYGGKETFDILKKYEDIDDMIDHATSEEWKYINSLTSANHLDFGGLDDLIQEAKKEGVVKTVAKQSAEEKAAKEAMEKYEKAKADLQKIEDEIKNKGADKVFTGIWKDQNITYADYEAKKHTIEAKTQFYEAQIKSNTNTVLEHQLWVDPDKYHDLYGKLNKHDTYESFLKDTKLQEELAKVVDRNGTCWGDEPDFQKTIWDLWNNSTVVKENKKMEGYIRDLEDFKKHGEEYSKLLAERQQAKSLVTSLKPKPDPSEAFSADAYTQARKDAAVWAQRREEADAVLRSRTGEVWQGATDEQKRAIHEYTSSYHKFNEPLRGIEYGSNSYKGVGNTDLNAGSKNNGPALNAMTDIIDQCSYDEDMWFQRGCDYRGMDKFFNCDSDLLRYGTQQELEDALLGTTPTEYGFMSMGSSKGQGFSGDIILNIYAPSGTKMMYVEPFSVFGNGAGLSWDGVSPQGSFGSELETIMQQGTQFRVVKVERTSGTLYFDLEVIDQSTQQRWIP